MSQEYEKQKSSSWISLKMQNSVLENKNIIKSILLKITLIIENFVLKLRNKVLKVTKY